VLGKSLAAFLVASYSLEIGKRRTAQQRTGAPGTSGSGAASGSGL